MNRLAMYALKGDRLARGSRDCSNLFRDEHGLTTVSMVVSLLVAISLMFSVAQVYRINSASARVQDVADAAAIAAENQVSDFVLAARLCDAVVLSLSLTSLVSYGVGVVALCVPGAQSVGDALIEAGGKISCARDDFSEKAKQSLESLQKALPYLCAVRSAAVAAANDSGSGLRYFGVGLLVPAKGGDVVCGTSDESDVEQGISDKSSTLKEQAKKADEAAKKAAESKQRAFERECGDYPGYFLYERADQIAGLSAVENPFYTSVDAWSFSVALERAQAYYRARVDREAPSDDSAAERARSALRLNFYKYASSQLERAFVHETSDSFDAFFPKLPRNTEQMKETSLYTDAVYPFTEQDGVLVPHAWPGCPRAEGARGFVSLGQVDQGGYSVCPACEFSVSSMGSVAAASTAVDNGFEYHYAAIADAAEEYRKARSELDPVVSEAKDTANSLLELVKNAISEAGSKRIEVLPPGSMGAIAFVVDVGQLDGSKGLAAFVGSSSDLGPRVAVSGATLIAEESDDGRNAISSLLDGYRDSGSAAGALGIVLDCWAWLLSSYSDGQDALAGAVERALDEVPLAGASGLGSWAAGAFRSLVADAGLAPAKVESLKPVLVNTGHVAGASDLGVSAWYLEVKKRAISNPFASTDLLSSAIDGAKSMIEDKISGIDSLEVAEIKLADGGSVVRVEIPIPQAARDVSISFVEEAFARLRALRATLWGGGLWE